MSEGLAAVAISSQLLLLLSILLVMFCELQ
jgi:hypothetical protein